MTTTSSTSAERPGLITATAESADHVRDLLAFLDAGPSPYHVVAEAQRRLLDAGFTTLDPTAAWPTDGGRYVVVRDGALVAFADGGHAPHTGFRIVGAHSDSPGFRLKPEPDTGHGPWRQLAVEIYGGPLLNSWLDRDLGLAGRVAVRTATGTELRLVRDPRPLLRIPQLAIHLDRDVNEHGLKLDKQRHLNPVWGLGPGPDLATHLAALLDVSPDDVLAHDLAPYDLQPATLAGASNELIASARLDNLCSCHAGLAALTAQPAESPRVAVLALFDHEEVGSTSARGAAGTFLAQLLERTVLARGGDRTDLLRALADSSCVSADMAHATHPNYPDRHEPGHHIALNGGPVLKVNANQRYATDAATAAGFAEACDAAGVPLQRFVGRNDLPCGSTIGPSTAAQLGVPTVDVGVAQLGMHSARELCGAEDPHLLARALRAFLMQS